VARVVIDKQAAVIAFIPTSAFWMKLPALSGATVVLKKARKSS
jgi:hypothetical protein